MIIRMEERNNSFKQLEAKWEAGLPAELERHVSSQTHNFAMFGRVVEVFVPNALEAVVHLIGGDAGAEGPEANPFPGRRSAPEAWPDWRTPPGR